MRTNLFKICTVLSCKKGHRITISYISPTFLNLEPGSCLITLNNMLIISGLYHYFDYFAYIIENKAYILKNNNNIGCMACLV